MTSNPQLVCDNSTVANFKQWGSAISAFFATAGWTQSSDTGQVNWSTISAVPGSNAYVYEIWQPNDGLTNFFVKIEYGNMNSTNTPGLRLTLSTSTNGAGTATGFIVGPWNTATNNYTPASTTTQYPCYLSGAAGRIGAMLWCTNAHDGSQLFAIERSVNSSGAYTGTHVTLVVAGWTGNGNNAFGPLQQTLHLTAGAAPVSGQATNSFRSSALGGPILRVANFGSQSSSAFNGSIGFDTITPYVGYFDQQLTVVGTVEISDLADQVAFSTTLYGATRTYMPCKIGLFNAFCPGQSQGAVTGTNGWSSTCLRYD